jgi:hypothetical protein
MKTINIKNKEGIYETKQVKTIKDLKEFLNEIVDENNEFFYLEGYIQCCSYEDSWEAEFLNESYNKQKIINEMYEAIFNYVGNETFEVFWAQEPSKWEIFYGDDKKCISEIKNISISQVDKLVRI